MQQAGTERPGTMAAVLGLATAEVEAACRAASSGGAVVVAQPERARPDRDLGRSRRRGEGGRGVQGARCQARGATQGERRVSLILMAPAANHLRVALEHAPFQDPLFSG